MSDPCGPRRGAALGPGRTSGAGAGRVVLVRDQLAGNGHPVLEACLLGLHVLQYHLAIQLAIPYQEYRYQVVLRLKDIYRRFLTSQLDISLKVSCSRMAVESS